MLSSRTLGVGQRAPDFALPGSAAGRFDTHRLTEYTDREWAVVLVFYPFDFHPACTEQWCSLRVADWLTTLEDVVVLGVSTDGVYAHAEYALGHNIGFTLLADTDGRIARAYGVLADEFEGHRGVPGRATFVIDPDRIVQFAWAADGPEDQPDMESLRKATNCRGGECTIERTEGADGAEESV